MKRALIALLVLVAMGTCFFAGFVIGDTPVVAGPDVMGSDSGDVVGVSIPMKTCWDEYAILSAYLVELAVPARSLTLFDCSMTSATAAVIVGDSAASAAKVRSVVSGGPKYVQGRSVAGESHEIDSVSGFGRSSLYGLSRRSLTSLKGSSVELVLVVQK